MTGFYQEGRGELQEKMGRIEFKEGEYAISKKMAEYIDMLESYLMELEERVVALETMMGLRGLDLSKFE